MRRLALLIVLASGTASAAPITFHVAGSTSAIDHVDVALHEADGKTQGMLYLTLSSQEEARGLADLTFTLPHGSRVIGLSLRNSEGLRSLGRALAPDLAEQAFRARMIGVPKDPALVEQVKTAKDHDTYSLRVYPLSRTAGAIVELAVELPGKRAASHSLVSGVGAGRVSIAAFDDAWTLDAPASLVDTETALYADDPQPLTGRIEVQLVAQDESAPGTTPIRARVRSHLRELAACFLDEKHNYGEMQLQLVVVPGGRVSSASVAGVATSTNDCVTQHLNGLSFARAPDEVTTLSYPLFWLRT